MLILEKNVLMCIVCDLQLMDRDESHQDDHESQSARSPLHLAVSPSGTRSHDSLPNVACKAAVISSIQQCG